jgi:hypothetical protein
MVTTSALGVDRDSMPSIPETISSGSSNTPTASGDPLPRDDEFMMKRM